MKRMIFAVAAVAVAAAGCRAATAWSLDSCITYALEHNITVNSRALSHRSAELSVTEAKDRFLPTLAAGANESFSFGRGLTAENIYAHRNTSSFGWNVGLSVPLFRGLSNVRNLELAKANLTASLHEWEAAKDDVTLNVISQYLQVLYNREMLEVARQQRALSAVEVARREELLAAGKIPELDLLEARSQLAQDEASEVSASNNATIALLDLTQLLEWTDVENFDILPLTENPTALLSAESVFERAMQRNASILAARQNIVVADKNISVARTGYMPTLSFSAGIGSSYYTVSGIPHDSFGSQMSNNLSKSLGFSLSIPLFDAFSTRNSVRRARVQRLNAELELQNATDRLYKQIQQAYYQATAAQKQFEATEAARNATLAAFEAMQLKYDYGKANATEFEQAKTAYIRALSENVNAKYQSILRLRILEFYNK